MSDLMKILIAYDGSSSAEAALDDLQRSGMPEAAAAVTLSVVEQWMPVPKSYGMVDMHLTEGSPNPNERAILFSQAAAKHVRMDFPSWEVTAEARIGSPATVILEKAEEWGPDLIVLGPRGHSGLGRWVLGSVSQKVMTHARCSVRLSRFDQERADAPIRVAIGVDGSPGAELAVNAAGSRNWPAGTEFGLINADFALPEMSTEQVAGPITSWIEEERRKVNDQLVRAVGLIESRGFNVGTIRVEGDPKHILIDEIEKWNADCLFVGAERLGLIDRFLLGSISSAVATRAHCSVEIVRPK